jgi:hypothetical protein
MKRVARLTRRESREISRSSALEDEPPVGIEVEAGRKPLYIAFRLWAIKDLNCKEQTCRATLRVFLLWKPEGCVLATLPATHNKPRVYSTDAAVWTDELVEALPTLGCKTGKIDKDADCVKEFMRKTDASRGRDRALFSGERAGSEDCALLTFSIEATCQLELNFEDFPFDVQTIALTFFLPKMHKDSAFQFVVDKSLRVPSEKIAPDSIQGHGMIRQNSSQRQPLAPGQAPHGHGMIEIKEDVDHSLIEWELSNRRIDVSKAAKIQTEATVKFDIKRRCAYYDDR